MTTTNPALRLYQAWDSLWRLRYGHLIHPDRHRSPWSHPEVALPDERPWRPETRHNYQLLNWSHGIQPTCLDENWQPVYAFGKVKHGNIIEDLFHLDADGNFAIGSAFRYSDHILTWGPFDKLVAHTFLGGGKAYRRGYVYWVNPLAGSYPRRWINPRDWEKHLLYVQHSPRLSMNWMHLKQEGPQWVMAASPEFETYEEASDLLKVGYESCRDYYAKWRRKYFRDNGIPDPDEPLGMTDIETVDYIEQHLNVYDPPKARLLRNVAGSC